jgi:hypothetical protein
MRERLLALAVMLAAAGAVGCETFGQRTCDTSAEGNPTVFYTGGATLDGVYMSSPWQGPLLLFPGGQHYALAHGLGAMPSWIQVYLSFEETAVDGGLDGGGNLAPAAGNDAEIVAVDGQWIYVANDTCSSYWLLVIAGSGSAPSAP